MKKLIIVFAFMMSSIGWADSATLEQQLKQPLYEDLSFNEQKQLAQKQEAQYHNYDMFSHDVFENERWRIYNKSAYRLNPKEGQDAAHLKEFEADDLTLSLGYGMEYNVDQHQKLGYEYRSRFPDDQGEMVRFFWNKSF